MCGGGGGGGEGGGVVEGGGGVRWKGGLFFRIRKYLVSCLISLKSNT